MRQVVARIDVDYKRPILFRPEPYDVETWVTRIGTSSYDLACRIVDADGHRLLQGRGAAGRLRPGHPALPRRSATTSGPGWRRRSRLSEA